MPDFFLRSPRLGFRPWRESDLPLAEQLWSHPEVTRFITTHDLTPDEIRDRLQGELASCETTGLQYWPIFRLTTGDHVGCCGLRPHQPQLPELGVHISPAYWRKGYAFEAATTVIQYAFSVLNYRALFAGHNPQNEASRKLVARLGFVYTHDEFYEPTGLHHPSYILRKK